MAFGVKSAVTADVFGNSFSNFGRVGRSRRPTLDDSLQKLQALQQQERTGRAERRFDRGTDSVAKTRQGLLESRSDLNRGVSDTQEVQNNATDIRAKLTEARQLATAVADGTADEDAISKFQKLQAEISGVAERGNGNGRRFLDGSEKEISFNVGMGRGRRGETVEVQDLRAGALGVDTETINIFSADDAEDAIEALDAAIGTVARFEVSAQESLEGFALRHDAFSGFDQEGLTARVERSENDSKAIEKRREVAQEERPGFGQVGEQGVFGRFDRKRADEAMERIREMIGAKTPDAVKAQTDMLGDGSKALLV